MDTWKNTTGSGPNGIDPYYTESKDGTPYLVYGSFFGGIYLKELNADGTAVDSDTSGLLTDYYGTLWPAGKATLWTVRKAPA